MDEAYDWSFQKATLNPWTLQEGGLEDEIDDIEDESPFHDAKPVEHATWGRLKAQSVHVEDYLDWEASLKAYFEWKTMNEYKNAE